jgi:hypothetical protein
MSECLPDLTRYIRQREDASWKEGPSDEWLLEAAAKALVQQYGKWVLAHPGTRRALEALPDHD